ncbi:MAG: hypothetical protein ACLQNE_35845 [Thermoguttaceae bacterium]
MSKEIRVTISGENVSLETLDWGDTIELLKDLRIALCAMAAPGRTGEAMHVSLASIQEGSVTIAMRADDRARNVLGRITSAIERDDPSGIPIKARRGIRSISKRAKLRSLNVGLDGDDVPRATITHDHAVFTTPKMHGATSLLARVIRVGGEGKATAKLRLSDNEEITAHVPNADLAQALGALLYQRVELRGEATWSARSFKILAFKVTSLGTYIESKSDPVRALAELREASHGFWDTVDPDEYIRELRSE